MADSERRRQVAALGAHELHAQYPIDETTKAGRKVAEDRLRERLAAKVDPTGKLANRDPDEFERRMAHARTAHFRRLALRAVAARQAKRTGSTKRSGKGRAERGRVRYGSVGHEMLGAHYVFGEGVRAEARIEKKTA